MSLQVNVYELMRHRKICQPQIARPKSAHAEDPFEHVVKKGFTIYGN
jgi:hypothetical protein